MVKELGDLSFGDSSLGNHLRGHSALSDFCGNLREDFRSFMSNKLPQSSLDNPQNSSQILECREANNVRLGAPHSQGVSVAQSVASLENEVSLESNTTKQGEAAASQSNIRIVLESNADSVESTHLINDTHPLTFWVGGSESANEGYTHPLAPSAREGEVKHRIHERQILQKESKRQTSEVCRARLSPLLPTCKVAKQKRKSGDFFFSWAGGSGVGINPFLRKEKDLNLLAKDEISDSVNENLKTDSIKQKNTTSDSAKQNLNTTESTAKAKFSIKQILNKIFRKKDTSVASLPQYDKNAIDSMDSTSGDLSRKANALNTEFAT